MSSFSAARSVFRRSSAVRGATSRCASHTTASRPPFRSSTNNSPLSSRRMFRSPVEMSFCVETMLPYHTATSSALMTSMLSISSRGYGCLPEGTFRWDIYLFAGAYLLLRILLDVFAKKG